MSVTFWSGHGQRLGWTKQKIKVSYFRSWQQLLCVVKQMNPVCVSLCCLDHRSPQLLAEPAGEAGSRLISQSMNAAAHHCCHFWWLTECQGCNHWNNHQQKVHLYGSSQETYALWTTKLYSVKSFFPQPHFPYPACLQCLSHSPSPLLVAIHFLCRICFPFPTRWMLLLLYSKDFSQRIYWAIFKELVELQTWKTNQNSHNLPLHFI